MARQSKTRVTTPAVARSNKREASSLRTIEGGRKTKRAPKKVNSNKDSAPHLKNGSINHEFERSDGDLIEKETIGKIEEILRTHFKSVNSAKDASAIEDIAVEIFEKALQHNAKRNSGSRAVKQAKYPKAYQLYAGKKQDGPAIEFYNEWWLDHEGRHSVYRADLRRLDPKLLQAMENQCREQELSRANRLPPTQSKRTEDRFRDASLDEEERLKAAQSILRRDVHRRYQARRKQRLETAAPE